MRTAGRVLLSGMRGSWRMSSSAMSSWLMRSCAVSSCAVSSWVLGGLFGACWLVGCGGAAAVATNEAQREDDGCGRAVRLGAECWSAEGTRWSIVADGPAGTYEYELELLAAGRARANDHQGASPATDEWFQDGPLLRVFLADRFVEYRARIENGTILTGEAQNVRGQRWTWVGRRVFGETACLPGTARLERACMVLVGTRWQIEGDEALLELLANGQVGHGGGEPGPEDRWEQDGTRVRFAFGGERYEAELTSDRELRGTVGGRAFTATRVESIPPPLRE